MVSQSSNPSRAATVAAIAVATALASVFPHAAHAADDALPRPRHVSIGGSSARTAAVVLAARRYAAFWNISPASS